MPDRPPRPPRSSGGPPARYIHWRDFRDLTRLAKRVEEATKTWEEWRRDVCWDETKLACHIFQWQVGLGVVTELTPDGKPDLSKIIKVVPREISEEAKKWFTVVSDLRNEYDEMRNEIAFRHGLLPHRINWKTGQVIEDGSEMMPSVLDAGAAGEEPTPDLMNTQGDQAET